MVVLDVLCDPTRLRSSTMCVIARLREARHCERSREYSEMTGPCSDICPGVKSDGGDSGDGIRLRWELGEALLS